MSRKATLVNNLKTISSRLICKEFADIVNLIYSKPAFWTNAYFVASCGGVTVEQVRKYIEKRDPLIFLKEFKGSR
jgi:putative transposase